MAGAEVAENAEAKPIAEGAEEPRTAGSYFRESSIALSTVLVMRDT